MEKMKRVTVVHIASFTRMCKIFEIASLSAVFFPKELLSYLCAGKVSLISKGSNLVKVGYIIRDTKMTFTVRCADEKDVVMRKPRIENGEYIYKDSSDYHNEFFITEYWPIHFKLSVGGAISVTLNRFVLNKDNNVVHSNC